MRYLILLLISLSLSVHAEKVWFRNPQITISLDTDKSCTNKTVLNMIQEQYHSQFKSAAVVWQGKALEACWMPLNGNVLLIDETGDRGEMSSRAFKRDPEV